MSGNWGFLPGTIRIERGTAGDYRKLARFHYAAGKPATWAGVWRAVYCDRQSRNLNSEISALRSERSNPRSARVVAVAVLSWPTLACAAREQAMGKHEIVWLNSNVRTISRVIVHPQFRGIGLASALVRRICARCPTRYVEAIAAMGAVHPLFEKGGMTRVTTGRRGYFLFDREAKLRRA
jgi:GNAT superfamily N-acetyltransferase